jgi:hypothetical protein
VFPAVWTMTRAGRCEDGCRATEYSGEVLVRARLEVSAGVEAAQLQRCNRKR